MANIVRKAQTGEPTVNGGQFGSKQRTEADAGVLEPADTVETAIENLDRVHFEIEAKRKELARLAADALSRTFAADVPDAVSLIVLKSHAALQDTPSPFQAVDADGRRVWEGWVKDGNWRRIERLVEMLDNDLEVLEYVKDTRDVKHEPGTRYWALALDRGRVDTTPFVDGFVVTTAAEVTGRQGPNVGAPGRSDAGETDSDHLRLRGHRSRVRPRT